MILVHDFVTNAVHYKTYEDIYSQRRIVHTKPTTKITVQRRTQQDCPKVEILRFCFDYFGQANEGVFFVWESNGKLLHDVSTYMC